MNLFQGSNLCHIVFFEVIGIIKRKALIKELAAAYHAECLAYCQEILELQKKSDEVIYDALLFISNFRLIYCLINTCSHIMECVNYGYG